MVPRPQVMSQVEVDRICSVISEREGKQYRFFRFLNLHKLSLVFVSGTDQKVLTAEHCTRILNGKE